MAGIFNKPQQEAITKAASSIEETFKQRWHQKQFDDFRQNELAAYNTKSIGLLNALRNEDNPDAMAQHFINWKQATMEFMTEASNPRYANNPYIAQVSQNIFQATQQGLDQYLQMEEQMEERTPEARALKKRGQIAEVEGQEAGTKLRGAQAEEATAKAEYYRKQAQHPELFKSSSSTKDEDKMFTGAKGSHPTQWLSNMYRPDLTKERESGMAQVRRQMATEILNDRRGSKKPGGFDAGTWGDSADDLQIIAQEIPENKVRQQWEKEVISRESLMHGMDPQAALGIFGERYQDAGPVGPVFEPLTGAVSDGQITEQLFGAEPVQALRGLKNINTANIDEMANSLPEDLTDLGNGPIQQTLWTTIQSEGVVPRSGEKVSNYNELLSLIMARGIPTINHHIGGVRVPDSKLDKETLRARERARKLFKAMIQKYGPTVAERLGIEVPKKEPGALKLLGRHTATGRLLKKGSEMLGGFFGDEVIEPE